MKNPENNIPLELSADLSPEVDLELSAESKPPVDLNALPEVMLEVEADVSPEADLEVSPEVAPEVSPEITAEVTPAVVATQLSPSVSIFNPEISITAEHWAVSFAKHSRDVGKENSHHGILIIQSDNRLYRREVLPNGTNTSMCQLIKDTRMWTTPVNFENQVKLLIWKDEDSQAPMSEIAHRTWSITAEQGKALLNDIEKDKDNPPPFYLGGDSSLFKPQEIGDRVCGAKMLGGGIAALSCLSLLRNTLLPNPIVIVDKTFFVAQVTAVTAISSIGFFADPKKPDSKAHNCATWCVEKLTNLNIPEINKDLRAHFTDKFAYVTGLHISVDEADRAKAQELLIKGATGAAAEYIIAKKATKQVEELRGAAPLEGGDVIR